MLRHREIIIFISIMSTVSLLAILTVHFLYPNAALLIIITCITLMATSLTFTQWRYNKIRALSGHLRQITAGNHELDIRDYIEGELSILKDEIYKVTLILQEQSITLREDKLKLTDAISDISHQLKTPLTSMMVMAELLSQDDLPTDKRHEFKHRLNLQLERMEWLVSSLLKLSKLDAGTAQFNRDTLNVATLINRAVEPLLIPMELKEQQLIIEGDDHTSLVADMNWLSEALLNIVKNSMEHTPAGGTITIAYSDNALFTHITVTDSGQGIDKADLPHIFQRFYKGKQASDDSIGIGLAMAHAIITKHNGTIEVTNQPAKGTQFQIKIYKQTL